MQSMEEYFKVSTAEIFANWIKTSFIMPLILDYTKQYSIPFDLKKLVKDIS
jgi:hypothetical protein